LAPRFSCVQRLREPCDTPAGAGARSRDRSHRGYAQSILVLVAVLVAAIGIVGQEEASWPPLHLRDTNLYADWDSKTISRDNLAHSPQYPLWTDGAAKARWMYLPAGTWIDASDPDEWRFPVGTRLWKEFRFARRAETRFIEHTPSGWRYATYVWNEDETEAVLAPEGGIRQSVEIRPGIRHAIPSRTDCLACHEASPVRALGVSALQLSPDRDPNAPHAERLPAGAVDLWSLVERGLVRNLPPGFERAAPRIEATTPTARAALGYLHANCGSCHASAGELASLDLALNYSVRAAAGQHTRAVVTSLGRPSRARVAGLPNPGERVRPGDPDASVLLARMASRHPVRQMPPLGSRLVDEEAVRLIRRWIAEDLGSPLATHELEEARR
jgi:hypothetical protein